MDRRPPGQILDGKASVRRHGRGGLAPLKRPLHLLGTGRPIQEEDLAAGDRLAAGVDHAAGQGRPRTECHDAQIRGSGAVGPLPEEIRSAGKTTGAYPFRRTDSSTSAAGSSGNEKTPWASLSTGAFGLLHRSVVLGPGTQSRAHGRFGPAMGRPAGSWTFPRAGGPAPARASGRAAASRDRPPWRSGRREGSGPGSPDLITLPGPHVTGARSGPADRSWPGPPRDRTARRPASQSALGDGEDRRAARGRPCESTTLPRSFPARSRASVPSCGLRAGAG